ncbi:DUF2304 domain-containing protein [Bradyrhizobium septentrionale]|uniref:DUF2304 domain-containing protein n=1 Tax=Bradyrhizobium septentrionale TaxID=1404411 RepID=UPI001596E09E|nr:DUF2304 domain-containing protein [Bradyrhizobium septentrionale]UGY25411.1 DUF2304 domain-containing protein [Bradyrhizobium septentrionale]
MIAQLLLTALLTLVLVYAWSAHRTVPIIGLLASSAALAGLYFVWMQEHATALAALVGIGRGSDLIVYIWVVISLLIMLNLHLKLRLQLDMITRLARAVAIDRAKESRREAVPRENVARSRWAERLARPRLNRGRRSRCHCRVAPDFKSRLTWRHSPSPRRFA